MSGVEVAGSISMRDDTEEVAVTVENDAIGTGGPACVSASIEDWKLVESVLAVPVTVIREVADAVVVVVVLMRVRSSAPLDTSALAEVPLALVDSAL
jgi:hypothetical protein